MSRVVSKPAFCICENKDADQLRGNREADQRLCFYYKDSTIPLLPKSEISSLSSSSVAVPPGLCPTWLENPNTGFLRTRLKLALAVLQGRYLVAERDVSFISLSGRSPTKLEAHDHSCLLRHSHHDNMSM